MAVSQYHRDLSRAFLARMRLRETIFYFHGASKRSWSGRWHGPAVVGHEGANLWLSHKDQTLRVSIRLSRVAEPQEQLPWVEILQQTFPCV